MGELEFQEQDHREFIYLKPRGFSISPNLVRSSDGLPKQGNLFEIKEWLKKLGKDYSLPTMKKLNQAFEYLWNCPDFQKVAVDMLETLEATDDIISFPNENDAHPVYVEPEMPRENDPVLIQHAVVGSKIIRGGERKKLTNFPIKSGRVKEDIEELGIKKGTRIFFGKYNKKLGAVKSLMKGRISINPERRYVLAVFSPWDKKANFRLCSDKPTENVALKKVTLEDYL